MSAKTAILLPFLLSACATEPVETPSLADAQPGWAERCEDFDDWDKPGPPIHVFGNTWYVGTCGIASILIAENDSYFLIDSGTEKGADVVLANIRALGFDPANITLLLNSHEHHDHVGGMAKMQRITGADLMTSPAAQEVLRTGKPSPEDPQFAIAESMAPVPVTETFGLGNRYGYILDRVGLKFLETPGHTPGAMTWYWRSCEDDGECRDIVYADSLSPISSDSYRFSDHPAYPEAFRASLQKVAALDCDILLTPHPSASGMRDKLLSGDWESGTDCRKYAADISARLDERLAKEAAQ